MEFAELKDREVFRVGTWNGRRFTKKDLDDIVEAAREVGFRPPLKLGHAENSGDPAWGWVENIRREGNKLLADFVDVPEELAQQIKEKRFDNVSAEIFFNLRRGVEAGTKLFRRALKAVAILGAETPAVSGLKPLSQFNQEADTNADYVFFYNEEQEMELAEMKAQLEQLQEQLKERDEKLKSYAEKAAALELSMKRTKIQQKAEVLKVPAFKDHVTALYTLLADAEEVVKFGEGEVNGEAVVDDLVAQINAKAAALFNETARLTQDKPVVDNPGAEVAKRAEKLAAEKDVDYFTAVREVLAADTELARAYTFGEE
jgi:hypothetical protein